MKSTAIVLCCFLSLYIFSTFTAAIAGERQTIEVIVRAGENLYDICNVYLKNFQDWPKVAAINGLKKPDHIFPGQKLKIPIDMLQGTTIPGVVAFVAGNVTYRQRSCKQWSPAEANLWIYPGDVIRTGNTASAEIRFGDGRSVLLRQNTEFCLKESRRLSRFQQILEFLLNAGKAILHFRDNTGQKTRYLIKTPSAIAAARGTHFRTDVDISENMRCEVLRGRVDVTAQGKRVELRRMQGTLVAKGQAPLSPVVLLQAPSVKAPEKRYRSLPVKIGFTLVEGAKHYRIEIARQDDFKRLLFNKRIVPGEGLLLQDLEDGVYFLRSRSIDAFGLEGPSSLPLRFSLRANPLAPFVRFPQNGARVYGQRISLRWMRVPDARRYHLQVSRDPEFHNLVADLDNIQSHVYRLEKLSSSVYYFRIRSIAEDRFRGEWSKTISFEMAPFPASPKTGKPTSHEDRIEWQWRDVGPGFHYHVQIAADAAFQSIIIDEKTKMPRFSFLKPSKAGTYYVRISSIDPHGVEGKFSKPQSFEIDNPYAKWIPAIMILLLLAPGL